MPGSSISAIPADADLEIDPATGGAIGTLTVAGGVIDLADVGAAYVRPQESSAEGRTADAALVAWADLTRASGRQPAGGDGGEQLEALPAGAHRAPRLRGARHARDYRPRGGAPLPSPSRPSGLQVGKRRPQHRLATALRATRAPGRRGQRADPVPEYIAGEDVRVHVVDELSSPHACGRAPTTTDTRPKLVPRSNWPSPRSRPRSPIAADRHRARWGFPSRASTCANAGRPLGVLRGQPVAGVHVL